MHAVAFGQYWRPERFIDNPALHKAIVAKGRENILEAYNHIERQLAERTWSTGGSYTVVDPLLLVFYMWGNLIGLKMQTAFPNWSSHTSRIVERVAVKRVLRKEGLPQWLCIRPISSTLAKVAGKLSI